MRKHPYSLSALLLVAALGAACGKQGTVIGKSESDAADDYGHPVDKAALDRHTTAFAETTRLANIIAKASADSLTCETPQKKDDIYKAISVSLSSHERYELSAERRSSPLGPVGPADYNRMAQYLETTWNPVLKVLADNGIAIQLETPADSPAHFAYIGKDRMVLVKETVARDDGLATLLSYPSFKRFIGDLAPQIAQKTAETTISWSVASNNSSGTTTLEAGQKEFTPVMYTAYPVPSKVCQMQSRRSPKPEDL